MASRKFPWAAGIILLFPLATLFTYIGMTSNGSSSHHTEVQSGLFSLEAIKQGMSSKVWADNQAEAARKVWDTATKMSNEDGALMDGFKLYSLFPETFNCDKNFFRRIGSEGDGGKWSCGEFFKPKENDCVAVSLGSNGQFDFEESILQHTNNQCTIYTFDCTGTWKPPHENIKFNSWCLGKDQVIDGRIYKSWDTITADLGIKHVDFFKIDIEGFEWVAMPTILENWGKNKGVMPKQISIEMHFWNSPAGTLPKYQTIQTANGPNFLHPIVNFFKAFYDAGYHVAATEYNPQSSPAGCCQEYTFVKAD
ncbi:methyltransferase domain-containing protein [Obelidium mucronatum]|nr:methyltransferase domain-containing protein [Obelidium mucronatum]